MLRIDSHQHFWKYDAARYDWITDEMVILKKDYLPIDLKPVLEDNHIAGCVVIQAHQSEIENSFLLKQAHQNDFIKGVVGWIDLQAENAEELLAYYQQFKKLKGFRHVLQGELKRDLMLKPEFKRGINLLNKYGFTYDLLILPDQLVYAHDLVKEFPNQQFVINHLAKPYIKDSQIDDWEKDIKAIASCENVFCKISGMVTEANWEGWKKEDFIPYIDAIVHSFGTSRIMYGSDWPVCLVAASYGEVLEIVKGYFVSFSKQEQQLFFGGTAIKFYNIN